MNVKTVIIVTSRGAVLEYGADEFEQLDVESDAAAVMVYLRYPDGETVQKLFPLASVQEVEVLYAAPDEPETPTFTDPLRLAEDQQEAAKIARENEDMAAYAHLREIVFNMDAA